MAYVFLSPCMAAMHGLPHVVANRMWHTVTYFFNVCKPATWKLHHKCDVVFFTCNKVCCHGC